MPAWLFAKGQEELGEMWIPLLRALNRKAPVALRVNRLKGTRESLKERLKSEGVDSLTDDRYPDALILKERTNVFRLPSFHDGLFEVQDCGSQTIAPFLGPRPGERIADGCAGAGGKSLHLAALMQNKGKIISMDVHEWKLKELKSRAARNGVDIIETKVIESTKTLKRMEGGFSRVLLDVPCSGIGALRRNPDSKWKLRPQSFSELSALQRKILEDNRRLVSPKGQLVYSTCSVFPSENEEQVQWFLKAHPDFVLIKEHWERPHQQGFDGFYMALLERRG
jgi:16S rRNA (cytosine967-C5)-methyltransferase